MNRRLLAVLSITLSVASLCACGGGNGSSSSLPPIVLEPGARYFSIEGKQQFLAARNIAGRSVDEIGTLLARARRDGTRLVRFHLTSLGMGITSDGGIDEAWAAQWDQVFDRAEAEGIYVIPVFGVWADWNDGSNGETWHTWDKNPLNVANGGPASTPLELYQAGSAGQRAWVGWLEKLVQRWQPRPVVAAWEVFSELNLVTRGTMGSATYESRGVAFAGVAAAAARQADPSHRPVTASLSGYWNEWLSLYSSAAVDVMQIHLYGYKLNDASERRPELDELILSAARTLSSTSTKPLLLGESGLDWQPPTGGTATTDAEGPRATRHATWAALVSGLADGRALWWEDGYAVFETPTGEAFVRDYPAVEQPVLAFLDGRSMAGMAPLDVASSGALLGGAVGDARTVLGWFRAPACSFPAWQCDTNLTGETIVVDTTITGGHVTFHDPSTGEALGEPVALTGDGSSLTVPLPSFTDDVAFELTADP